MIQYVLETNTRFDEILIKASFLGKKVLFCVVNGKKLLGVISYGDLARALETHHNMDFKMITADEISNKKFTKFYIENLENEITNFLKERRGNINRIPLVDSEDNLITILDVDSFVADSSWKNSQKYEFNFWNNIYRDLEQGARSVLNIFSRKERAGNIWNINERTENNIMKYVENKYVLEIGCGPFCGYLPYFWYAKKRVAIEPLLESYASFWNESANMNDIIDEKYAVGADVFIPELVNKIDGIIISQNCLDHSPNWPFILSNISSYAASGSYLYLSTDIHHAFGPDTGHYNITPNADRIYRMIENLGFKILETATNAPFQHPNLFVRIMAVKD